MRNMKFRLAVLLAAIIFLLSACSYWIIEDETVQVGSPVVREDIGRR